MNDRISHWNPVVNLSGPVLSKTAQAAKTTNDDRYHHGTNEANNNRVEPTESHCNNANDPPVFNSGRGCHTLVSLFTEQHNSRPDGKAREEKTVNDSEARSAYPSKNVRLL